MILLTETVEGKIIRMRALGPIAISHSSEERMTRFYAATAAPFIAKPILLNNKGGLFTLTEVLPLAALPMRGKINSCFPRGPPKALHRSQSSDKSMGPSSSYIRQQLLPLLLVQILHSKG